MPPEGVNRSPTTPTICRRPQCVKGARELGAPAHPVRAMQDVRPLGFRIGEVHSKEERRMSELIAIGYEDTITAHKAAETAEGLARDLIIEPDAIAVIV